MAWLVMVGWDRFQHYRDRRPAWVKNYVDLLANDEYRNLSLQARGVLHGLWLEYARSNRQLRDDTAAISRRLGARVPRATLESLRDAGFLEFSASQPLAPRSDPARAEKEKEKETPLPPSGSASAALRGTGLGETENGPEPSIEERLNLPPPWAEIPEEVHTLMRSLGSKPPEFKDQPEPDPEAKDIDW